MNSFFYHQKRQFKKKNETPYFHQRKFCVQTFSSFKIQNVHILVIKFMNYKHAHICKRIACSRSLSMLGVFCYFLAW